MKQLERTRYSVWADGEEVTVTSEDNAYRLADAFVNSEYSEVRIIRAYIYLQQGDVSRTVETYWKEVL